MSGWRRQGARLTSDWYGPLCINVDNYTYDDDWCQFLRDENYDLGCEQWAPGRMEVADQFIRNFLIWKYGEDIRQWARDNNLGNRWKYEFNLWNRFPPRGRRGDRWKCGNIRGVATGQRWGGASTRKNRKSRKANTRRNH